VAAAVGDAIGARRQQLDRARLGEALLRFGDLDPDAVAGQGPGDEDDEEGDAEKQARGGRDNDPRFGMRMRGTGPWAEMLRARFELARKRLGLNADRNPELDTGRFCPPRGNGQLELDW